MLNKARDWAKSESQNFIFDQFYVVIDLDKVLSLLYNILCLLRINFVTA